MVQTILNLVHHFGRRFRDLNNYLVLYYQYKYYQIIFQCYKTYGIPIFVTRANNAPNMADPDTFPEKSRA